MDAAKFGASTRRTHRVAPAHAALTSTRRLLRRTGEEERCKKHAWIHGSTHGLPPWKHLATCVHLTAVSKFVFVYYLYILYQNNLSFILLYSCIYGLQRLPSCWSRDVFVLKSSLFCVITFLSASSVNTTSSWRHERTGGARRSFLRIIPRWSFDLRASLGLARNTAVFSVPPFSIKYGLARGDRLR